MREKGRQRSCPDFRETTPQRARADMFIDTRTGKADPERSRHGGLAIGIPGEAAGFAQALREHGSLRPGWWPAPAGARRLPVGWHLSRSAGVVALKFPPDSPLRALLPAADSRWHAAQLLRRRSWPRRWRCWAAADLQHFIAKNRAASAAKSQAVQQQGGILTAADLRGYKPVVRKPLEGTYRDYRVYVVPPPRWWCHWPWRPQILNARPPLREGAAASSDAA